MITVKLILKYFKYKNEIKYICKIVRYKKWKIFIDSKKINIMP